jgi:uncharacterized integral membrane protein
MTEQGQPYYPPSEPGHQGYQGQPGPAPAAGPAKKQRSVSFGQILGGILLVLIIVFIVENTEETSIRIIAGPKVHAPVYVALLIAAVVGALVAALLSYRRHRRSEKK